MCGGMPFMLGLPGYNAPDLNLHCAGSCLASRRTVGGVCERHWRWAGAAYYKIQINWKRS